MLAETVDEGAAEGNEEAGVFAAAELLSSGTQLQWVGVSMRSKGRAVVFRVRVWTENRIRCREYINSRVLLEPSSIGTV